MNNPSITNNILINTGTNFEELYEYGSEIGKGRYATVKKCYCKKSQKCYAAKIIKNFRTKNTKMNLNIVENEITALTLANSHSSIINLYAVFYHKGDTILILEYATEKDLHIYLDCEGAFEEEKACQIIYQVLIAIDFLHSKNILHLDIKPENVLLMNPLAPPSSKNNSSSSSSGNSEIEAEKSFNKEDDDVPVTVKLCDFSFSQIMTPGKPILGMMGTVAYSAPEVLQYEPLTKATDMWSLGVLTHVLLTEYTPFGNGTEKNLQTETNILSVREKEFKCIEDYFENVSLEAQDFIENCLQFRPKHRLTVEEALNHQWFKKFGVVKDSSNTTELNIQESQTVELNIRDEATHSSVSLSNSKKIEIIQDDKNNNNLSSLIGSSSLDIQSSSASSISSIETSECNLNKISQVSIESFTSSTQISTNGPLVDKLNSLDLVDSHYPNKSAIGSLIFNPTNFKKISSTNSNSSSEHDKQANTGIITSNSSALASASILVTQIATKLATTTSTTQY